MPEDDDFARNLERRVSRLNKDRPLRLKDLSLFHSSRHRFHQLCSLGLDPQLQQLMLQMMQMQQQTLQVMMPRMDADERRRKEAEAASAAVADPFGVAAGSPTAKASAPPPPAPVGPSLNVGSNRAEKYLPALPVIDAASMGKGRVKELEEYHRWCEVLASWLALIDDNYVNELRQAMVHHKEIKQSEMSAPVVSRSARLFYYLQQSLQKFERGMELVRSTSMRQAQAACGYEVMRQNACDIQHCLPNGGYCCEGRSLEVACESPSLQEAT